MDRAEQHIAYSVMSLRVFIPSLLIAATCAFLVSLGFWQLDRADEKRSIEASIKNANTGTVELIMSDDNLEDKEYYEEFGEESEEYLKKIDEIIVDCAINNDFIFEANDENKKFIDVN